MSKYHLSELKTWFEVCTHNEENWREFLSLCSKSFQNAEFPKRFWPDVEKRKKFLPHYFNYCYETMWSEGRAGLVCLKAVEEGKDEPEIVMGAITVYRHSAITKGDTSLMMKVYQSGTEALMKVDAWCNDNIHVPIRKAAESLGTVAWYGTRHAVSEKYKNQGFGMKYMLQIHKMLYEEGLRLSGIDSQEKVMLPIVYGDRYGVAQRKSRFQSSVGTVEVGHLHYNHESGLKCCEDPSANEGDKFSCIFVTMYIEKDHPLIPHVRKVFSATSKSKM